MNGASEFANVVEQLLVCAKVPPKHLVSFPFLSFSFLFILYRCTAPLSLSLSLCFLLECRVPQN